MLCLLTNHFCGRRHVAVVNDRDLRFDNTGFFTGDLLDGISQDLCMVQTDGGNNSGQRCFHTVGRIQSSSQPRLQYTEIHVFLLKIQHSHHEQRLKIAGMTFTRGYHLIDFFLYLIEHLGKILPAGHLAINLESFPDIHQMR